MEENKTGKSSAAKKLSDELLNYVHGASYQEIQELKRAMWENPFFDKWDFLYDPDDDYTVIGHDRQWIEKNFEDFFDDLDYWELNYEDTPNKYIGGPMQEKSFTHQEILRLIREYKG